MQGTCFICHVNVVLIVIHISIIMIIITPCTMYKFPKMKEGYKYKSVKPAGKHARKCTFANSSLPCPWGSLLSKMLPFHSGDYKDCNITPYLSGPVSVCG